MSILIASLVAIIWYPGVLGNNDDRYGNNNTMNVTTKMHPCEQQTSTKNLLLAVFSATILSIGVLGNILTIILIRFSTVLRTHGANVFVTSLATADLGVSVFVTTIKVDYYMYNGGFCHGYSLCVFFHLTDSFFPIVSITSLVIIAVDRWYACACPYEYVANMTVYRAKCVTLCVWAYSMLWALLGVFSWDDATKIAFNIKQVGKHRFCYSLNKYYHTTVVSVIYIFPMMITTYLYVIVVHIAMKKAASTPNGTQASRRRQMSDTKAAKTIGVIFLAFTICWLPHIILVIIQYWNPTLLKQLYLTNDPVYDVMTTVIHNILPTFNSCVNPFIYFITSADFRQASNDVILQRCRKKHKDSRKNRGEICLIEISSYCKQSSTSNNA